MNARFALPIALCLVAGTLHAAPSVPVPKGVEGAPADALAHELEQAVKLDAWARTGAVRFTFVGKIKHVWDRQRMFDRVQLDGAEILVNLGARTGKAFRDGKEVTGDAGAKLVKDGYAAWANDSFWLNPIAKLFDEGVTRARVMEGGKPALLVHYASGGVTPGDSYLWVPGSDGKPKACKMWVSVFPTGGMEVTWEGWTALSTGALVATTHASGGHAIPVSDVVGAATLAELEPGKDVFAPIAH